MAYRRTKRMEARILDRRAQIFAAARALVSEEGWAAATVSNVASRADIATGTVYRYWASKTDLCVEIVARVSAHEIAVLRQIAGSADAPHDKLASAVRTFLRRSLRGRRLAYALIAEPCDPEVEEVRLKYRAELAQCIADILQMGAETGAFRVTDVEVTASCIAGAFMEALAGPLRPIGNRKPEEDAQLIEKVTAFCMRAAVAPVSDDASSVAQINATD